MCLPDAPSYTPPPAPPEPTKAPKLVDASVSQARSTEASQARLRAGRSSTVLTNPTLLGDAATGATGKTKLGQ